MARMGRFKIEEAEAWYHLCARAAAYRGEYPLAEPRVARKLTEIVRRYAAVYFCDVAAFSVMGNHYHLVVRFEAARDVDREELERRACTMYPGAAAKAHIAFWSDEDWERYRRRLFDVSELMRNVQAAFARWYNQVFDRRGHFWGDRFKSVLLGDLDAVLDCMLYIELNPVRAGLVERPEEWRASSLYLREIGRDEWLLPLSDLVVTDSEHQALIEYRTRIYYRGSVPTKEGQAALPLEVLEQEIERGFATSGVYRRRLAYFVEGVILGSEELIREHLRHLRETGAYLRRKHPIPHLGGLHHSLREQRRSAVAV